MTLLELALYILFYPLHAWDSYRARKWAKARFEQTPKALPVEGDFEGPIVVHLSLGDRLRDREPWENIQRARKAGMN